MTDTTYRRTGGGRPAFDETLEISEAGVFRLVRRISEDRAGTFAGTLDGTQQEQLAAALAALGEPPTVRPTRGGTVLERIEWSGGTASFPFEQENLPPAWEHARDVLQTLVEDLKAQPDAALELRVDDKATTATFAVVGDSPVSADFGGAAIALKLFDEDEEFVDSASVAVDITESGPFPPGWTHEVALDHGLPFDPAKTLQISVGIRLDGRAAELSHTAGKGWY